MSRQRSAIEWQDIVAATFVVGPDLIEADYLLPQEAVDNLPPEGGSVYVLQGSYSASAAVTLPIDKNVTMEFAAGAVIAFGATVAVAFAIPDGLTVARYYKLVNPQVTFTGVAGQDFIKISDQGGHANVDVYDCYVYRPGTLVNFAAYDVTFINPNNVKFHAGVAIPLTGVSKLVAAPAVAGSYGGFCWISFQDTLLDNEFSYLEWTFNADADIIIGGTGSTTVTSIATGSACNGFAYFAANLYFGDGDFTVFGASFGGTYFIVRNIGGNGVNSRVVVHDVGSRIEGYVFNLCFKVGSLNTAYPSSQAFAVWFGANIAMANAAVEMISDACVLSGCFFQTGYPNGCVKITDVKYCKVFDCHFRTAVTGKTVIESGTADENDIHDNTGLTNGTGYTIIGPKTKVNNAVLADKATSTTNALVEIVPTITNPKGLMGIGSIKNTDGANSLDLKETFTDAFGVTSSVTNTIAPGDYMIMHLQQSLGTGRAPYVSYKAEVIDTVAGSHATYVSHFTSMGSL